MDCIKGFIKILTLCFGIDKRVTESLSDAVFAVLKAQSSNLAKIAEFLPGGTKVKSKYRQLQRLIDRDDLTLGDYIEFVLKIFKLPQKLVLIIDRTNWKYGKKEYNLLVLSVIFRGAPIPLLWVDLDKAGCSDSFERCCLMVEFAKYFGGFERIKYVLADAEFIGDFWFEFLQSHGINFVIRVRKDMIIFPDDDVDGTGEELFADLKRKKQREISGEICGVNLKIIGSKNTKGELQILAVNGNILDPVTTYKERWGIELLFFYLKGDGFKLEETHVTKPERIFNLFMILALAACMSFAAGFIANKKKPRKLKNHGRYEISIFKYGLKILSTILNQLQYYIQDFNNMIKLIFASEDKFKKLFDNIKFAVL
jgi:hypothetical protein